MTVTGRPRFDVAALRHDHRIEVVVAASGVELTQRGQGFMGCCPFHDDSTPSLSVGGVPDRFHCFGCGAGGDVIEYVHRLTGLSFTDAVQALQAGTAFHGAAPSPTRPVRRPAQAVALSTAPQRARAINNLAWEFFTSPANISDAETYLRDARGIDVGPLCEAQGGRADRRPRHDRMARADPAPAPPGGHRHRAAGARSRAAVPGRRADRHLPRPAHRPRVA